MRHKKQPSYLTYRPVIVLYSADNRYHLYGRYRCKNETSYIYNIDTVFENLNDLKQFILSLERGSCDIVLWEAMRCKQALDSMALVDYSKSLLRSGGVAATHANGNQIELCEDITALKLVNGVRCKNAQHLLNRGESVESLRESLKLKCNVPPARIIYAALTKWFGFEINILKISPGITLGSDSLKYQLQHCFHDNWKAENTVINDLEKSAIYGARNEVFNRSAGKAKVIDINKYYLSLYNECLIPDPSTATLHNAGCNWRHYLNYDDLGIYRVYVNMPRRTIGLLPYRSKGHAIIYPYGSWWGTYTNIELKQAMKYGVEVIKCDWFIRYRGKHYLRSFAHDIIRHMDYYKNDKFICNQLKLFSNAQWGKYAETIKCKKIVPIDNMTPEMEARIVELQRNGGVKWDASQNVFIIDMPPEPSNHYFPAIGAFVLAYGRTKLLKAMLANEGGLISVATDSLYLRHDWTITGSISDRIGDYRISQAPALTQYLGQNQRITRNEDGTILFEVSGVPHVARVVEETADTIKVAYKRVSREKESYRQHILPGTSMETVKILNKNQTNRRDWQSLIESLPRYVNEPMGRDLGVEAALMEAEELIAAGV